MRPLVTFTQTRYLISNFTKAISKVYQLTIFLNISVVSLASISLIFDANAQPESNIPMFVESKTSHLTDDIFTELLLVTIGNTVKEASISFRVYGLFIVHGIHIYEYLEIRRKCYLRSTKLNK